ncbi:hypothetical protein PPERSA_08316 [Pseudocohnilembus persalinus]|uniref:Uncharacterized protein n=1 Tax=Pseudocohnilembus persalinus TaxID=266149 RepID=A0A0V0QQ35_PSEPJ|nr:hypothetical protein PPERSA_08316 [Pseudocohnilembus persalinus]|eukprot:KRX04101.1 hypothetical protein PPERSA_08316 [Pseudocohnilembus persalinus]
MSTQKNFIFTLNFINFINQKHFGLFKDINDILQNKNTPATIILKDINVLIETEQYYKRRYKLQEYPGKIKMLTEYYKFHNEIPRLFMLPISKVLNKYHDKKRRLDYLRITKMLKEEEKAKNPNYQENEQEDQIQESPLKEKKNKKNEEIPAELQNMLKVLEKSILAEQKRQEAKKLKENQIQAQNINLSNQLFQPL